MSRDVATERDDACGVSVVDGREYVVVFAGGFRYAEAARETVLDLARMIWLNGGPEQLLVGDIKYSSGAILVRRELWDERSLSERLLLVRYADQRVDDYESR